VVRLRRKGRSSKTIRNVCSTLHSLFELAIRRRWATTNPCKAVELPAPQPNRDIRFLTQAEPQRVLSEGIPPGDHAILERALYLTAAMTGLRQGELLGLRWRDLDTSALKVRVRQAYVRGEFKGPKSLRGSRGVPMAAALVEALDQLRASSRLTAEDDLVFGHPITGGPLDRSQVRKRFQRACRRAGVRALRFHDLRTLQEWMGHRDPKTTMIYADYQPGEHEAEIVGRAFGASETQGA
jgi:integrase